MGLRPSMSENQRHEAIGRLAAGERVRNVARHFNVHPTTILHLRYRLQHTGAVKDKRRSGRPRATTPREDRYLVTSSRRRRFQGAPKLAVDLRLATSTMVHPQIVRNRLHYTLV